MQHFTIDISKEKINSTHDVLDYLLRICYFSLGFMKGGIFGIKFFDNNEELEEYKTDLVKVMKLKSILDHRQKEPIWENIKSETIYLIKDVLYTSKQIFIWAHPLNFVYSCSDEEYEKITSLYITIYNSLLKIKYLLNDCEEKKHKILDEIWERCCEDIYCREEMKQYHETKSEPKDDRIVLYEVDYI